MNWLVPASHLSPDQAAAVQATPREHRVIVGAPGSGKTLVLVHRARHLLQSGIPAERLRIFIYNRVLADYIQSALTLLGIPQSCVSTFDSWCLDYFQSEIGGRKPWDARSKQIDWPVLRHKVREHVGKRKEKLFDAILVDESQDLHQESLEILIGVSKHITAAIDQKQQIYEQGSSEDALVKQLGLKNRNVALLGAFRCAKSIVELAARFISDPRQADIFRNQCRLDPHEDEKPLLFVADDVESERARLVDILKTRQSKGERIAILLPTNRQVFGYAQGLTEAGLEVEVRQESWRTNSKYPALDFSSARPKLLTYHSAKGITFDTVAMPHLVPGTFRKSAIPDSNLLFVGITRATRFVYLSTVRGRELIAMELLQSLRDSKTLAIQDQRQIGAAPPKRLPTKDSIGDLL